MSSFLLVYLSGLLSLPILRLIFTKLRSRGRDQGGLYSDERDSFALNVVAPSERWFNMGYWASGCERFGQACEALCELVVEDAVKHRKGKKGPRILEVGCGAGDAALVWDRLLKPTKYLGITIEEGQYKRAIERTSHLNSYELVRGDAVKVIKSVEGGSYNIVVAIDCAYHFRSRDDFLRSTHRILTPGGYLCMTDLLLPHDRLSIWTRTLLRMLCLVASLPYSNLRTPSQHRRELEAMGYKDVEIIDISDDVWPGWLAFMRRQDEQIGHALLGWTGLMTYARVVEWYSGAKSKDKKKLGFYLVKARK